VKHYLITIVILLSFTVNTVVGMTVFQQPEHPVGVAESTHSSMVSHHQDHSDESDNFHPHDCNSETECHDNDMCCKTLCDVPCVISPPNVKLVSIYVQSIKSNYYSSKSKHPFDIPISPD